MSLNPNTANNILVIRTKDDVRQAWIEMLKEPLEPLGYKNYIGTKTRREALETIDFAEVALIVTNEDFTVYSAAEFLTSLKKKGYSNIPVMFFISPDGADRFDYKILDKFENAFFINEPFNREELNVTMTQLMTGKNTLDQFGNWLGQHGFEKFASQGPLQVSSVSQTWRQATRPRSLQVHMTDFSPKNTERFKSLILEEMKNNIPVTGGKVQEIFRHPNNGSVLTARPGEPETPAV